jgi:hypothetical protein
MAPIRIPLLLCIALLTSASAQAAGVPELRASSFTVNGVYSLTFNLNLASTLPAGTTITCRAQIVPNQAGVEFRPHQLAPIPVSTATGQAAVAGSTAICAAEIPVSWTVMNGQGGAVLSYEIDAVSNTGSIPLLVRSTGPKNIGVAFPALGGSASLRFNLTF